MGWRLDRGVTLSCTDKGGMQMLCGREVIAQDLHITTPTKSGAFGLMSVYCRFNVGHTADRCSTALMTRPTWNRHQRLFSHDSKVRNLNFNSKCAFWIKIRKTVVWTIVYAKMRNLKCAIQMMVRHFKYASRCDFGVHTVQTTVFRILIQNAHFELKFKLRTLLSCENSQSDIFPHAPEFVGFMTVWRRWCDHACHVRQHDIQTGCHASSMVWSK